MKEEKDKLRNMLFDKYFENQDGIILTDLVKMIEPVVEIWQKLYKNLRDNCNDFDIVSYVEEFKIVNVNNQSYLIIKTEIWDYLVIDLTTKRVLTKDDVIKKLNENFFRVNFNEEPLNSEKQFYQFYHFNNYKGNVDELLDLYTENERVFNTSKKIIYKIYIDKALTYLNINLADGKIYMSFQTPDQFLYENLWLMPDLTPQGMQDAQLIGKERMNEMFDEIKNIKIPNELIPPIILENKKTLVKK